MTGRTTSVKWIAGSAIVCLLALVGSWVLLVGPTLDRAAATREQAAQVAAQTDALRSQVEALRADHKRLGDFEAQLAALRAQLPDDARLTELIRDIAAAATATGVDVVAVDVSAAAELTGAAATAPTGSADATTAETAAADTATGGGTTTGTVPVTAPTAPPVEGMVAIPVSVGVVGGLEPVRAFVSRLQTGLTRALLVTDVTVEAREPADGDERRPPAAVGDVEATISTLAYVLRSETSPDQSSAEGAMPTGRGGGGFVPSVDAPAPAPVDPAQTVADAIAAAVAAAATAAGPATTQPATAAPPTTQPAQTQPAETEPATAPAASADPSAGG